jgi:hypothetical protein
LSVLRDVEGSKKAMKLVHALCNKRAPFSLAKIKLLKLNALYYLWLDSNDEILHVCRIGNVGGDGSSHPPFDPTFRHQRNDFDRR